MIRFNIFGCVDWHTGMIFICIYYINYIYIYICMIDPDCVCIYVWLAAAGGKGTEWTRPASQPGYTTQGTEQIVQQNRRWVVSFHENDALIFDCWMLCPHSCIWPCQSVKKTYFSICPLHCGFWEFWCWARPHEVENQPEEAQTSARCTAICNHIWHGSVRSRSTVPFL